MSRLLSDELVTQICELESYLEQKSWNPVNFQLITGGNPDKRKTGPFTVERIWYDIHEDLPTLGVTYFEISVKTGKDIQIFKPIRIGTPLSIVSICIKNLEQLLNNLHIQSGSKTNTTILRNYLTKISESFDKITEEMKNE